MTKVQTSKKPELIFGIIAKIGTDLDAVNESIANELSQYGYSSVPIKLTTALSEKAIQNKLKKTIDRSSLEKRYMSSMDACNELRKKAGNEVMAELAVSQIVSLRKKVQKKDSRPIAFIVRQLKRKEEVELLRKVYGDKFILVSCFSPRELRCDILAGNIADSKRSTEPNSYRDKAEQLIIRDENETDNPNGQRVRDAFPNADVIINSKDKPSTDETLKHFFKVFFGNPKIAPTKDEYGLFMASAAALRSTDLSRQVGAAIFTDKLEVVSLGSNEVPKYSGGTYLQDETESGGIDGRDAALGFDANAKIRTEIAKDAVYQISNLSEKKLSEDQVSQFLEKHLFAEGGKLNDLLILDITEFGRAVHAEMNAITDAARTGKSTDKTTLYCTTFPCHNCAKHIVASGIIRVVYIQPYPKSKAEQLYPDSISIDPKDKPAQKVIFEIHKGIAPNLYPRVFGKTKKKDKYGKLLPWDKASALPSVNLRDLGLSLIHI